MTATVPLTTKVSGSGSPVLVLHGFTGSGKAMDPLTSRLINRHCVITPDLVGHGDTPAPASPAAYTFEAQVDSILESIAGEHAPAVSTPIAVVGYSMGARLALGALVTRPELFGAAFLIGVRPGLDSADEQAERAARDQELADVVAERGIEWFASHWVSHPTLATSISTEADRSRAIEERVHNNPVGMANTLRAVGPGSQPSLWERLDEVSARVTLIAGDRDTRFVEVHQRMAALMPNARSIVIEDAGHIVHRDQPDTVADLILRDLS